MSTSSIRSLTEEDTSATTHLPSTKTPSIGNDVTALSAKDNVESDYQQKCINYNKSYNHNMQHINLNIKSAMNSDSDFNQKVKVNVSAKPNSSNKMSFISIYHCSNPDGCVSLHDVLKSFNASVSEEQAWALIYQSVKLYKEAFQQKSKKDLDIQPPKSMKNLHVHKDGTVHISMEENDTHNRAQSLLAPPKRILLRLGVAIYNALDYNLTSEDECTISSQLEQLIQIMIQDDIDDEGIEQDSDEIDGNQSIYTKELDYILELCTPRVLPTKPNEHYKAVCRALATESLELRVFLEKVFQGDTELLRIQADVESSRHELQKLGFSDWARFWMQVVHELRRGVRLKKSDFPRAPLEFELTPYEILMEDIRSRKYNLRKVMVNGDVPPKVKKDAHALILEFIRSRPPLKKASERTLPPLKWDPSPREQLLDSIRRGRVLKHIQPKLKTRLLPPTHTESELDDSHRSQTQTPKRRLIKVDFSLLEDDDNWNIPDLGGTSLDINQTSHNSSFSQYQNINNENNPNDINTVVVLRRKKDQITHDDYHRFCDNALESYDLATQCESRRASMRRHTIVGCQSNLEVQSTPTSRPESRQSEISTTATMNPLNPMNQMTSAILDEWTKDTDSLTDNIQSKNTVTISDRLALTLEEIVHIRSVITKAELEGLPVGVQVKEDVEKRKVCFLCLRTRFTIFGQWGVQCRLCKRTVCSKCYSKMRIPTEHFRNVPVVLLSPSLINSPVNSTAASPSHHAHHSHSGPSSIIDDSFPKSLMERLLRSESNSKKRQTVGSAPSTPKVYHSSSTTPSASGTQTANQMTVSMGGLPASNGTNDATGNNRNSVMSRSMEGPRSLPPQSPARPHSNNSTLDRKNRFTRKLSSADKESMRGELMSICNDCRGLVHEIIRSSKQTRSSARNKAIRNLTLDLSPVYKRW